MQESSISQQFKKSHTVQSVYRCLTTHTKNILPKLPKKLDRKQFQIIKQALSKLTKKQRKKSSIAAILFGTKKQFVEYVNHLKIQVDITDIDELDLQRAQVEIRLKICEQYENNSESLWNQYRKQLEKGKNQKKNEKKMNEFEKSTRREQNIEMLKKLIDEIIINKKLIFHEERAQNKGNRIVIKDIIKRKDVIKQEKEEIVREEKQENGEERERERGEKEQVEIRLDTTQYQQIEIKNCALFNDQMLDQESLFSADKESDLIFSWGRNAQLQKPIELGSSFHQFLGKTQINLLSDVGFFQS